MRPLPRLLRPSWAPTPSGTARRPRLTTPLRIPRPLAAGEGECSGRGGSSPPTPTPGCCAPGSPSSVHCGSGGGGSSWRRAVRSGGETQWWAAGHWDRGDPGRAGRETEPRVVSWALAAARLV